MDIIQQIRNRQAQSLFPSFEITPEHKPDMLYIGCVDARLAIDSDIGIPQGKAMIFRNIAALVPKCTSNRDSVKSHHIARNDDIPEDISIGATLELYLNTIPNHNGYKKQIVVSGHTNCGGIKACQHGTGEHQDLALYLDGLKDAHLLVNEKARAGQWDSKKTIRELEKQSPGLE
jgi:carbonic anhydrase